MIGILARLPQSFGQEWAARIATRGAGGLLIMLVEIVFLIAIIMGLIMLVQGTRKVPVNYAKQIVGNRQFGGARNFLPLKVNAAGVMPIIFAQAILFPANSIFRVYRRRLGQIFYRSYQCCVHACLFNMCDRIHIPVHCLDF
jgi:preprotein translocase subunit SecY